MTDKLIIFDTTLRDGEQSPGVDDPRREAAHRAAARTTEAWM
jgi:isopropylmalate/homocitrate/citramalate synthase